jgi:hypothetical protein
MTAFGDCPMLKQQYRCTMLANQPGPFLPTRAKMTDNPHRGDNYLQRGGGFSRHPWAAQQGSLTERPK